MFKSLPSGVVWPAVVMSFLVGSVGICMATLFVAISDPSYHVEENYYERALRWDEIKTERVRQRERGWVSDVRITGAAPWRVEVTLRDGRGEPVVIDDLSCVCFHLSRSGDRTEARLSPVGDGRYDAEIKPGRHGVWRVEIRSDALGVVATSDVWSEERL